MEAAVNQAYVLPDSAIIQNFMLNEPRALKATIRLTPQIFMLTGPV